MGAAYDVIMRDGSARLLRFRRSQQGPATAGAVLLVPSLINRCFIATTIGSMITSAASRLNISGCMPRISTMRFV